MNSLVLCTMEIDIMLLLWYHAFIVECEDKDLIFRSEPYFIDSTKMFLIYLTFNFNPNMEIFYAYWNQIAISSPFHIFPFFLVFFKSIDKLACYIISLNSKEYNFPCAKICVRNVFCKTPKSNLTCYITSLQSKEYNF